MIGCEKIRVGGREQIGQCCRAYRGTTLVTVRDGGGTVEHHDSGRLQSGSAWLGGHAYGPAVRSRGRQKAARGEFTVILIGTSIAIREQL
jgi:hypothetical protein